MKLNQLIGKFHIHTTNEEKQLLEKIGQAQFAYALDEREQRIAENLIKKSLLKKVRYKDNIMVVPNEHNFK